MAYIFREKIQTAYKYLCIRAVIILTFFAIATKVQINELVQERRNFIANASCTHRNGCSMLYDLIIVIQSTAVTFS